MRHRIAGHHNGEVITVLLSNEAHQIGGILKVKDCAVFCTGEGEREESNEKVAGINARRMESNQPRPSR